MDFALLGTISQFRFEGVALQWRISIILHAAHTYNAPLFPGYADAELSSDWHIT
jgi:hypothetical protein